MAHAKKEPHSSTEYKKGQKELRCMFVALEKARSKAETVLLYQDPGGAEKFVRLVRDVFESSMTVV